MKHHEKTVHAWRTKVHAFLTELEQAAEAAQTDDEFVLAIDRLTNKLAVEVG